MEPDDDGTPRYCRQQQLKARREIAAIDRQLRGLQDPGDRQPLLKDRENQQGLVELYQAEADDRSQQQLPMTTAARAASSSSLSSPTPDRSFHPFGSQGRTPQQQARIPQDPDSYTVRPSVARSRVGSILSTVSTEASSAPLSPTPKKRGHSQATEEEESQSEKRQNTGTPKSTPTSNPKPGRWNRVTEAKYPFYCENQAYSLIVRINGRIAELRCHYCYGNHSRSKNGRLHPVSGVYGMLKHVQQSHKQDSEGTEITDDWVAEKCVGKYLGIWEQAKVDAGEYAYEKVTRTLTPKDRVDQPKLEDA